MPSRRLIAIVDDEVIFVDGEMRRVPGLAASHPSIHAVQAYADRVEIEHDDKPNEVAATHSIYDEMLRLWEDHEVRTAWSKADRSTTEYFVKDGVPVGYTDIPPSGPFDLWNDTDGRWTHSLQLERESMVVNRFQARAGLLNAGRLDEVEAMMSDPNTDRLTRIMWTEKLNIHRTHPTTVAMFAALGISDAEADQLFRDAMKLEE